MHRAFLLILFLSVPAAADPRYLFVGNIHSDSVDILSYENAAGSVLGSVTDECYDARAAVADPLSSLGYLACAGKLVYVDGDSRGGGFFENAPGLGDFNDLAMSPDGARLYVADMLSDFVALLELPYDAYTEEPTYLELPRRAAGSRIGHALRLALTPDGTLLYALTDQGVLVEIGGDLSYARILGELDSGARDFHLSADGLTGYATTDGDRFYTVDLASYDTNPAYAPPHRSVGSSFAFAQDPATLDFWFAAPSSDQVVRDAWVAHPVRVSVTRPGRMIVDDDFYSFLVTSEYTNTIVPYHFAAGLQPGIALAGRGPTALAIGGIVHPLRSSSPWGFVRWARAGVAVSGSLKIKNAGKQVIKMLGTETRGDSAGVFATSGCEGILAPGAACTVSFKCTPPPGGERRSFRARLLVRSDAQAGDKTVRLLCAPAP